MDCVSAEASPVNRLLWQRWNEWCSWMFDRALPFWSVNGVDSADGAPLGFCAHLDLDGSPATVAYKRVRVQARQVYVFSHAALLGWSEGLSVARRGFDFMQGHGALPSGA